MIRIGRLGFVLLWIAAAVCAGAIFYFWDVNASFMGIVETRTHKLGSPEAGRIRELLVSLGDEVKVNQLLVRLDTSDLETESAWIKEELTKLENMVAADKRRYALEYEKLLYQRDASASGMNQRRADLEAKRAEIEAIDAQIRPLVEAEKAGLGRSRELTDLTVRRDALARYVKEGNAGLSRPGRAGRSRTASDEPTESESVVLSMLRRRLDRMSDLDLRLRVIETSMNSRNVLAPCNGRVVTINYLPGDAVDKFVPIVTIEESQATFVDVYIPEGMETEPRLGDRVAVYSKNSGSAKAHASVVFVDPGYSPVPDRLRFRNLVYYARKFRVKLEDGHTLLPGEATEVELLDKGQIWTKARAQERSAPKPAPKKPQPAAKLTSSIQTRARESLSVIEVPEVLRKLTPIEPSGIAWLKDISRYVMVSDDTGRGKSKHAPEVLLMDREGKMDSAPVRLHGINQVNDLESIAPAPDGSLYLISSQNLTKKGKRPETRQQILKVKHTGRDFSVVGAADLYSALASSYKDEQVRSLGLGETDAEGQLLLNIEGSAFYRGDLLLGVKKPRPAAGALLLRLKNPERFIKQRALEPGQLTRFAQVDLRTPDGRPAAFADLVVDEQGELLALSTVPDASDEEQVGGMHRLRPTASGRLEAIALYSFPGLKSEGLCSLGNGQYTVVFDTDDKLPLYYLTVGVTRS